MLEKVGSNDIRQRAMMLISKIAHRSQGRTVELGVLEKVGAGKTENGISRKWADGQFMVRARVKSALLKLQCERRSPKVLARMWAKPEIPNFCHAARVMLKLLVQGSHFERQ
jgi:hypothetical protein